MAKGHDWELQTASVIWIFIVILGKSFCKTSQTYYMLGSDCGQTIALGGAVVYSHFINVTKYYGDNVNCRLRFKARNKGWKLMLRMLEMDIPDRQEGGICNDALYISDADNIYRTMQEAGGNIGMCGNKLPSTIYSTGKFLTVHFRTDSSKPPSRFGREGRSGRGFKFIITAFREVLDTKEQQCESSSFQCDNTKCIENSLTCDRVDHCGDYSDESAEGPARCGVSDETILSQFLDLGVAASVGIIVGGLIVIIFCTAALVCCCRNSFCKNGRGSSSSNNHSSTTTSIVANGGPGSHHGSQHGSQHGSHHGNHQTNHQGHSLYHHPTSPFHNPTHQGYYPMQPVYPSPHGSVYSGCTQNSAFTRDSGFIHNNFGHTSSVYSSQAPSYHRSHTPTSSKSGKSHHSNTSVTYTQNTDKVMLPVNL